MKIFILICFFLILTSLIAVSNTYASGTGVGSGDSNTVSLPNPLTGGPSSKNIPEFLGQIINYALGIIGSLALVMVIYGGATWMLSAGSSEQVSKGKNIIIWAALGLAIIFTAYAIVRFVITAIGGVTA